MTEEQYATIRAELARNEQEHESYNRRLHEHDDALKQITNTQIQLVKLTNSVENLAKGVSDLKAAVSTVDSRVAAIEKEPGETWKKIVWEVLKAVVLAVAGIAIGYFIK